MLARGRELLAALIAILLIAALYAAVVLRTGSIPAAREFFGHALGVVGFTLMLMTETLYSLRKRSRAARWGRMSSWLQFHIFTGLVGPFLALLHTSWKFNGLAGVVALLTVIIVISGFIGRYIYTAVPRTADGAVLEARELTEQIRRIEQQIAQSQIDPRGLPDDWTGLPAQPAGAAAVLGRAFSGFVGHLRSWRASRGVDPALRAQYRQAQQLARRRSALQRQVQSLASARRLLSVWHAVHIPIGMALFTAAAVHIAAALYYATFLR